MRTLITFCFVLCVGYLAAQNPNLPTQHDYTWISGYEKNTPDTMRKHTIIDFNTSPPQITEQLGNISFAITNLMMSDNEGELSFYSEGQVIQNKFGETLENGDDIAPDMSMTQKLREQTMLSVPYPENNNKYFVTKITTLSN